MTYFTQDYKDFINSPQWHQLRETRKAVDGSRCQTCGDRYRLEVHHKYNGGPWYKHKKALMSEDVLSDLITLCHDCHEAITLSVRNRRSKARGRNNV